ncbi:MAG: pantoate--beta-alanine ligase [Candidatus Promineifilaceae bacterium]|nr:pantoate--beta-alanine ligase [Candidatus Promineifilaceae bacterium]
MIVTERVDEVRRARWQDPTLSWGLVPTMGYLHEGHLSLVRAARPENERVAASIYVNPTQFAPDEDLESYPRDLERDLALLQAEGVDLVFTPSDDVMYPAGFQTYVSVEEVTQVLEGASRPTHFRGVTTIVAKLFNVIRPTRAYFGQKDYQQTVVLRRMVQDLNFDVDLVVCPIVREADGLAMSSRNEYLTAPQREAANVLYRALTAGAGLLDAGERDAAAVRNHMQQMIAAEPLATADYVSVAHPDTLEELEQITERAVLSMAVFVGKTRLIDNVLWNANETGDVNV